MLSAQRKYEKKIPMICRSHLFDFSAWKNWTFFARVGKRLSWNDCNCITATLTKIIASVFRGIICWFNFAHLSRPLLHLKGIKLRNNALWMFSSAAFAGWKLISNQSDIHAYVNFQLVGSHAIYAFVFVNNNRKSKITVMNNKGTNAYRIRNFRRVKKNA